MSKITVFRQLQQLCPSIVFEKCSEKYFTGRQRKMTPWNLFLSLLLAQLSNCRSFRDIVSLLSSHSSKNYHNGIKAMSKSTLSRTCEEFDYRIFAEFAQSLLNRCRQNAPAHRFRFNNKLYSVDSTTIPLCLAVFDWAHFRRAKGGVKVHVQLDHQGELPSILNITPAKSHDSTQAKLVRASRGDIIVFDRGYNDYKWLQALDNKGVFFVARLKKNAKYDVVKRNKVLRKKGITRDDIIRFEVDGKTLQLRLVAYYDKETKKRYVYLTNNTKLAARTIADIYKDRWKIELFFKELKGNLKIKTFMGTSENAVKTQIYIALCAYLLLKLFQFTASIDRPIGRIKTILASALFNYEPLLNLFRKPIDTPLNNTEQLILNIS